MLIGLDDVACVFDDACIRTLAELARLPDTADLGRFGESVRWAVGNYLVRQAEPSPNALRREIKALHRAAQRGEYEKLACLIERMTPSARRMIAERQVMMEARRASFAARKGRFARLAALVPYWRIPDPAELRNPATRAAAAEGFEALLAFGTIGKQRERPSGKPTMSLEPMLYAPSPSRAEPRRQAERELVMWLQTAVAEVGAQVALTARAGDASREVGPLALMVARVLALAGAWAEASAKGLAVRAINDLHQARQEMLADAGAQQCHDD